MPGLGHLEEGARRLAYRLRSAFGNAGKMRDAAQAIAAWSIQKSAAVEELSMSGNHIAEQPDEAAGANRYVADGINRYIALELTP